MRWRVIIGFCLALVGCAVEQPEGLKTIAAFEIQLPAASDRVEFLALLGGVARAEGLRLDAEDSQQLERRAASVPEAAMTIHATAWRVDGDELPEATVMDTPEHRGRAWIMFARGEDMARAERFREHAMSEIRRRWPDTLSLPVTPSGAIPHAADLIRTPTGYIVDPAAVSRYE